MKYTVLLQKTGYFLLTALIISLPAFYNGYPLVYFDSGNYIKQSIDLVAGDLNPIGYPLFIRAFSWRFSLWPVVFAQSLIVSVLIYLSLKTIFKDRNTKTIHFVIITLLTLFTGMGWFSSLIMADIFAPILILSIYLFLAPNTKLPVRIFAFISMAYAATTHFSIQYMLLAIFLGFLVLGKVISNYSYRTILIKGAFLLLAYISAATFVSTYHYVDNKGFKSSNSKHVIIVARLMETGILDKFLEENCKDHRYALCEYAGQFPYRVSKFVWDAESPFYKTGGWAYSEEEYKEIIHEVFTDPSYLAMFGYKGLMSSFIQLATFSVDIIHLTSDNGTDKWIKKEFRHEEKAYKTGKQAYSKMSLPYLNMSYYILSALSLMLIVIFILNSRKDMNKELYLLIAIVLMGIFVNAAVNGTFSNVVVRYQARINWLLVFVGFILAIKYILKIKIR